MLSLMKGAFESSALYPDSVTFLTSVKYLQTVRADNSVGAVVERINDLLTSTNTRLQGLQFLEIALQQNSDIYVKGHWTSVLCELIREPVSYILKEHICKILCLLLPYMAKDTVANEEDLQNFTNFFNFLLAQVENRVEWMESAAICLSTCLKCYPQILDPHKDRLLQIILEEMSYSVSSRTFEVFAECFCYIPSCMKIACPDSYKANWKTQYIRTLNSMNCMLNVLLSFSPEAGQHPNILISGRQFFFGAEDEDDGRHDGGDKVYPAYMRGVRRFINLSKCLAKMLSTKSKSNVEIPVRQTFECICRPFQLNLSKAPQTLEEQIVLSTLPQIHIASLLILESLLSNFSLVHYSHLISQMLDFSLQASNAPNISSESISPLRHAVWKFMDVWIGKHGARVSSDIFSKHPFIIEELLKDISIENSSQTNAIAAPGKSKKNMGLNLGRKTFINKGQQTVCKEALKALENILYSGSNFISRKMLQDIFTKIVQIAYAIIPQDDYPFPYEDDMCRKLLYSVLLAIAIITKADQREPIQCATGIFKTALQDCSSKVVRQCYKAMAMCRLSVHPKKPIPVFKESGDKQTASSTVGKFSDWSSEDYVQNIPPVEIVSNISENLTPRIAQTFHNPNEGEMPSEEYMQVDSHYSEQAAESQCNGEDILEIQNSSQCQDDVDSEDEDEEEDDERSYGDEEINQEIEMQDELLYIPSTSKIQVLNAAHITSDTEQNVGEPEYDEWRLCEKSEDSNKNMHLNGVRSSIVPEEGIPSASTQNVASENGIYAFDEEDIEEEEGEEDEEEENTVYPAEKRVPEYFESPAKKQKLDNEVKEEPQDEREGTRSPTLLEMKADFCCNEIDNVKS